jgi:hypothetical protein
MEPAVKVLSEKLPSLFHQNTDNEYDRIQQLKQNLPFHNNQDDEIENDEDHDYRLEDDDEPETLVNLESNISHLPRDFLGINTHKLGYMSNSTDEEHSFFELKRQALNKNHPYNDRVQALRTLCYVPLVNAYEHTVDVAKSIIDDPMISMQEKFDFFAKQTQFYTLPDLNLVYDCHKYFFEKRLEIQPSTEILLLNIRALFQIYDFDTAERNEIISLLYDMLSDKETSHRTKAEIYDIFITCGTAEERLYGEEEVAKLGGKDDYTNEETVHTLVQTDNAISILKALRNKHKIWDHKLIDTFRNRCLREDMHDENINKFLERILLDSTKFDGLKLVDIFTLILMEINSYERNSILLAHELKERLIEEIKDMIGTCTSGYMTRLINVLQGYVTDETMQMKTDPEKECKYAVYARLRTMISRLPVETKKEIMESLESEDKQMADEFIAYYWDDTDLIKEYQDILSKEKVREIADQACREFVHQV